MTIKQRASRAESRVEDGRSRLKHQNIRSTTHIKADIGMERFNQNLSKLRTRSSCDTWHLQCQCGDWVQNYRLCF